MIRPSSRAAFRASCLAVATAVTLASTAAIAQTRESCIPAFEEGQVLRDRLKLRAARDRFVQCARDVCAPAVRKDCAENLEQVSGDLPTVVFGARDEEGRDITDVRVFVDDEPARVDPSGRSVAVDPGQHVVRFEHPSFPPITQHVLIRMGERNRPLMATLRRPAPPKRESSDRTGPSLWPYVLAGVGLVGLGSFTFFAITGKSEKDRLMGQCAPGCTDAEVSGLKTRYIAADVSLAIGVIAAGIATYLFVTAPHGSSAPSVAAR